MKEYKYRINGNEYAVAVNEVSDTTAKVTVNGEEYTVEWEKPVEEKPVVKVQPAAAKPAAAAPAPAAKPVPRKPDKRSASAPRHQDTSSRPAHGGKSSPKNGGKAAPKSSRSRKGR